MVEFFNNLTLIGWIGVVIWVALPVLIFTKQDWFFNYERRLPKMQFFEEYCYTYGRQFVFMSIRFVVLVLAFIIVGKLLTAL